MSPAIDVGSAVFKTNMMKTTILAFGFFVFALAMPLPAGQPALDPMDQWASWRGPLNTGVAPHGDPPLKWDEKTNVKWKIAIPGKGSSTPIVWGDSVFVATAVDTGRAAKPGEQVARPKSLDEKVAQPKTIHQFILMCLDRQTGKIRWQKVCAERLPHEGHHETHSYAAGSPTTDGQSVWVSFGSRGVYCYDFSGNLKWERELGLMWTRFGFGEASTPVLHQGALVLNWDNEAKSRLIVLDAKTGSTRWEVDRDEVTSWNAPCVATFNGKTQIVVNGTKKARGYDFATGRLLWECGGQSINAIPSAVAADGVIYCMSGYGKYLAIAVPMDARGDLTDGNQLLWKHSKGTPYCPSPLLVDGKLYFTQALSNLMTCLDAKTGKPYFELERLNPATSFYGSPVSAGGRIYIVDQKGTGLVLKQSTKFEVLAVNKLDAEFDASPAVVGRQLFLRGHHSLYCIEGK
jgi:outer membrane protein assembly factor BamB